MKWVVMAFVIFAAYAGFRWFFDAPPWGAMVGGYVFWLVVRPKEWT